MTIEESHPSNNPPKQTNNNAAPFDYDHFVTNLEDYNNDQSVYKDLDSLKDSELLNNCIDDDFDLKRLKMLISTVDNIQDDLFTENPLVESDNLRFEDKEDQELDRLLNRICRLEQEAEIELKSIESNIRRLKNEEEFYSKANF